MPEARLPRLEGATLRKTRLTVGGHACLGKAWGAQAPSPVRWRQPFSLLARARAGLGEETGVAPRRSLDRPRVGARRASSSRSICALADRRLSTSPSRRELQPEPTWGLRGWLAREGSSSRPDPRGPGSCSLKGDRAAALSRVDPGGAGVLRGDRRYREVCQP